jgi:hypothetical protein
MYTSGSNQYEKQSIGYHVGAMQSVQKRLSDPELRTSPGLMLGILSLVSHDVGHQQTEMLRRIDLLIGFLISDDIPRLRKLQSQHSGLSSNR